MASSGNLDTSNQYIKYDIVVTENSTNIVNNTSNVTVKVRCWRTNTGYTTYGTGTCYCNINGKWYNASISSDQKFTYNSYTEIFNKTLDIPHNDDGTKSIWVSSYISHQRFNSDDQGFTVNLTTIARKSSFASGTSTSGTFGSAITVKISASSSNFKHKVMFTFGSKSETSGDIAAGTTSYTPTYAAGTYGGQIPNSTSGTGTLTLITLNGSTEVGRVSQNITMSLPSYTPTCSDPTLAEQNSTVSGLGCGYVQNKSTIKVTCRR